MAYCTVENVESYYLGGNYFQENSEITQSEVQHFINAESAKMNGMLKKRFVLPFTNATDLLILRKINELFVVCIVDRILRSRDRDEKKNFSRNTCKEANDLLNQILNGDLILNTDQTDAPIKFNSTDSAGNTVEPYFKISEADPDNFIET